MAQRMKAHAIRHSLFIALLFQIAWITSGVLCALSGMDVRWGLLIANLFTLWVPALFILLTHSTLSVKFQVGFAVFITTSSLIGSALGGYGLIPNWDTLVHVYSGILLAWFGFIVANKVELSIKKELPLWFKNAVALMTPLAFAAVWEMYEYTSDTLWGTAMQAGGLEDTIVDMQAALVGAVIALVVSSIWFLKRRRLIS